jgi:hypothetical protein
MSNFPVFFAVLYYIRVTGTWMQVFSVNFKSCSLFFSRANFCFRFDIIFYAALLNKLLNIKGRVHVIKVWEVFFIVGAHSCSKDIAGLCIFSLTVWGGDGGVEVVNSSFKVCGIILFHQPSSQGVVNKSSCFKAQRQWLLKYIKLIVNCNHDVLPL